MLTLVCYTEVYSLFAFLDCARYNEDFVKSRFGISRFCSIHFIVILTGWRKSFVILRTLLYRGSLNRGYTVKDQRIFFLVIILPILITISLDNEKVLSGEIDVSHYWDLWKFTFNAPLLISSLHLQRTVSTAVHSWGTWRYTDKMLLLHVQVWFYNTLVGHTAKHL